MKDPKSLPFLLLDNSSMMSVLNEGEFKCYNITFEEAKHILEVHEADEFLKCFSNPDIESVIFNHLGVTKREFEYKKIRNMRPGQNALVFKLYITPSETQPIIQADDGVEAKKIQNVYVYCQYLVRVS
ncbi:MAG: hypothetical protein E7481_07400 [Ruminococcaceae bacterium]|nr:hypothetical protein [Oscillospiraceae bacterium]MBQ2915262.1 hypothetical protein [Clostridia bacterium]